MAHTDNKEWDRCYCLNYCSDDQSKIKGYTEFDADDRRKYAKESKEIQVSKKNVTANYYAPFTNKDEFKLTDSAKYKTVNVKKVGEGMKYYFTSDNNDEIQLISFNKNEIKTNI